LTEEREVADYFEDIIGLAPKLSPKMVANWISGELFGLLNQTSTSFTPERIPAEALVELLVELDRNVVNQASAKVILADMFKAVKGQAS